MEYNNKNLETIKKQLEMEKTVTPKSSIEARLKAEKIKNLSEAILSWDNKKHAQEVSTFDPSEGVKFTDQSGTELPFNVTPTWVDQTKTGVTKLEYKVTLPNAEVRKFERRVRVGAYKVQANGIDDLQIPIK